MLLQIRLHSIGLQRVLLTSNRTWGKGFKVKEGRFRLDIWKQMKWKGNGYMRRWGWLSHRNRLPREAVNAPLLEVSSRSGWLGLWAIWSTERCPCPQEEGGGLDDLWRSLPNQTFPWFSDHPQWSMGLLGLSPSRQNCRLRLPTSTSASMHTYVCTLLHYLQRIFIWKSLMHVHSLLLLPDPALPHKEPHTWF